LYSDAKLFVAADNWVKWKNVKPADKRKAMHHELIA
jgi:hypothetical protein